MIHKLDIKHFVPNLLIGIVTISLNFNIKNVYASFLFSVFRALPRGFARGMLYSNMAKTFRICHNVWLTNSQDMEVSIDTEY